ncbi:MAG TPA: tail fiber protein [Ornithinibacter sp.]|nr:tail fiber protein [Ornithinibacter sp.]
MGQPYVGEIRIFAGNFAPNGWLSCDGQILSISENETLFQLIGTTYGGDGQSTFALPDLRGRMPVHQGNGMVLAETGGAEQVTLTTQQMPAHSHPLVGSAANASATSPAGGVPGTMPEVATSAYGSDAPLTTLAAQTISPAGGSQPHDNMQPFLCVGFIISLFGIFPSPT